jgi:hypothetical protein
MAALKIQCGFNQPNIVSSNLFQNVLSSLADDTDLSRHHLLTFSQKLICGWANIGRKVVHIYHQNNVSSNLFQNMLSGLADATTKNFKIATLGFIDLARHFIRKICKHEQN